MHNISIAGSWLLLWLFIPVWVVAQHSPLNEGLAQMENGQRELAIDSFLEHLSANPDDGLAHYNLALAYHNMGQDSMALPHLVQAEKVLPLVEQMLVLKGEILIGLQAYALALPVWEQCIQLNFLSYRAYKNLGLCHLETNDPAAALDALNKAVALNGQSATAYYYRGITQLSLGDTVAALADMDAALQLEPKYHEALLNRGNLYYQNGYYSEALEDYDLYLVSFPDNDKVLNNRGLSRSRLADHHGAAEDFTVAIEINPTNANYYFHRATEFFVLGDKEKAIADLDEALKYADEPFEMLYLRGKLYYDLGVYDLALEDLGSAHDLRPEHRKLTDFLFKVKLTAFFSRYWLYLLVIVVLLINGTRLYQRHRRRHQ